MSEEELQSAISVLRLPVEERTEEQIAMLIKSTLHISFFNALDREIHRECCKCMKLALYEGQQVILEDGDPESNFFVILKGSASVLVRGGKRTDPNVSPRSHPMSQSTQTKSIHSKHVSATAKTDFSGAIEVSILRPGETLDDLSSFQVHNRRVTVVAKEKSVFAVLKKRDLSEILSLQETKRLEEKVTFFRSLPMFVGWSKSMLKKLCGYVGWAQYKRRDVIYREGDVGKDVYFLIDGEVLVTLYSDHQDA